MAHPLPAAFRTKVKDFDRGTKFSTKCTGWARTIEAIGSGSRVRPACAESKDGRPHLVLRLTARAIGAKVLVSASVYFYGEGAGSAAARVRIRSGALGRRRFTRVRAALAEVY